MLPSPSPEVVAGAQPTIAEQRPFRSYGRYAPDKSEATESACKEIRAQDFLLAEAAIDLPGFDDRALGYDEN